MKTKLKRTLLLAAALLGAVGCGGNDASGITTYVYESARPVGVAAQTCILVRGPITVGPGWMDYAIDSAAGTDSIRALIISDSYYSIYQCDFSAHPFPPDELALDVSFVGSSSSQEQDLGRRRRLRLRRHLRKPRRGLRLRPDLVRDLLEAAERRRSPQTVA